MILSYYVYRYFLVTKGDLCMFLGGMEELFYLNEFQECGVSKCRNNSSQYSDRIR